MTEAPRLVTRLLAVPNISEGRDAVTIRAVAGAFGPGLLDVHSDPDHNRSVFTLVGEPGELNQAVVAGAAKAIDLIDLSRHQGAHPRVGSVDVAPIVHLHGAERGAACAEALVLADRLGQELDLPVFLYGALSEAGHTRAALRRGGPGQLAARIDTGELRPDFGPPRLEPRAGATLVAARPPLVAFNVELSPPATLAQARQVAEAIRGTSPQGFPSVRAIGLWLEHRRRAQVSMNVEDHTAAPLAGVLEAIRRHAPVESAELVGLAPRSAFDGFPVDVPVRNRRYIEEALETD